jgi:glycosyltransferase involved in cell wall biosynthesis
MRCLQISKFYPPINGGIENIVRYLSEGLRAKGVSVSILCSNIERKFVHEPGIIPVTRVSSWGKIASTSISPQLISFLLRQQRNYDIIHVHLPNPMANLAVFLTRPKCKIVVHWHSDIVNQKFLLFLYAPFQQWLLRRAEVIIATTEVYAKSSKWLTNFFHKTCYVPCCIPDSAHFNISSSSKLAAESLRRTYSNKKIVFSLGRMTYYKGFDVLIRASRYLNDDTMVLIGGGGELLPKMKKLVFRLGLENKVALLNLIPEDDLSIYFQAADLFCLPSLFRSEAFGLVIVEAMSYGKPVIATNISGSGVTWVNIHGKTGLNAEPGNDLDLANCIKKVLDNSELSKSFGSAARTHFEVNLNIDKMIDGTLLAYKAAISR